MENVNNWNRKLLMKADTSHDVALWLTKLDIEGASGFAPVSGACDPYRSCALNQEEGLSSAFIIAHEIAHMYVFAYYRTCHKFIQFYDPKVNSFIIRFPALTM